MADRERDRVLSEIEGFKRELGVVSDAELAAHIGYQRSSIAQWKKRGEIPASARSVIANTIEARSASIKARRLVDRMQPTERQLCRAIALRYLIVSTEDGDLEPDFMLYRVLVMDELELAASLLLRHHMESEALGAIAAYRRICGSETFEGDLTDFLRAANDLSQTELPQ